MSENGKLIVQDDAVALFDTAKFEQMCKVAKMMAMASLVPKHLQSNEQQNREADCMLVVQQARRWQMDPFALAQCSFVVGGKLGYEGKAIAAVVNSRADLKQRLKYDVTGAGEDCSVVVRGTFKGEDEERTIEATWKEGKALSQSGAKWKELPDQQLCYYAARKWARRHAPELIMGVLSADEIQAMAGNIGPDNARDIGGHSEAKRTPIRSMDDLADKLQAKVDDGGELPFRRDDDFDITPEPQNSPQEAGDDIVDTDTGEVTESSFEQPQAKHGLVHEQEGFDLGPVAIQIDMVRKGPKPTFRTADDAYKALCDRLANLDAIPGVRSLEQANHGFISTLPPSLIEVWQNAVDDKILSIQEKAA
ncbi:MAG: recombinase RecT [Geminicoccaceae bacterium]